MESILRKRHFQSNKENQKRSWLRLLKFLIPFLILSGSVFLRAQEEAKGAFIVTVTGKIGLENLGNILPHEHVTTDFLGAEIAPQPRYSKDNAITTILPHLKNLKEKGYGLFFECTPNYIGRDVELLKALSELSGLKIVTNTGYYAAVNKKFLPKHAYTESSETLAQLWEKEWQEGIGDTGIRPGFIKLGVGKGPLDAIEEKLLNAALVLHKKSGLQMAMHTGDGEAALSEYQIITKAGVDGKNMIWVHAQNGKDKERIALAKKGVWISLDGVSSEKMDSYVTMIRILKENQLLSRLLISHDNGWGVEDEKGTISLVPFDKGKNVPYQTIHEVLLPRLQKMGFTKAEIDLITIENPIKAYSLKP
ncbi:TatD family hydrolase [Ulvibacterium marinum]|uniref:phosphotriesterase family protein n=1 Tax=Ulvibacterium marinum TaxID=2419782 RepID=UPI0024954334|nr:TatD family hydrolase [Ulvibacterium marinum]